MNLSNVVVSEKRVPKKDKTVKNKHRYTVNAYTYTF